MEMNMPKHQMCEILEKALARLQEGWCQRAYLDERGNVCSMGAVYLVVSGSIWQQTTAQTKEVDECRDSLMRVMGSVGLYNDSHTQAEVEAKFREAIAIEKAAVAK